MKLGILCGTIAAILSVGPVFAASGAAASGPGTTPLPAAAMKPSDKALGQRWSDRIFDEFQEMQQRMNHLFHEATREVKKNTGWLNETSFTSSVKVSEDSGNYIVRLSLPDRDLNKVEAKVEGNNSLRITAQEEKKERNTSAGTENAKKNPETTYELGRYEQLLTLPGSVDASRMKIDRTSSIVTITLPKVEPAGAAPGHG